MPIQTVVSRKNYTKWIFNDVNYKIRGQKNAVILVKYYPEQTAFCYEKRCKKDYMPTFHLQCSSSGRACTMRQNSNKFCQSNVKFYHFPNIY